MRRIGDFDEAVKLIVGVLKQRRRCSRRRSPVPKRSRRKARSDRAWLPAIDQGGAPDKQGTNQIWGWSRLANVTQGNSKYEETFFHARLEKSRGTFPLWTHRRGRHPYRGKVLDQAKNDLWVTFRLYPHLGRATFLCPIRSASQAHQQQLKSRSRLARIQTARSRRRKRTKTKRPMRLSGIEPPRQERTGNDATRHFLHLEPGDSLRRGAGHRSDHIRLLTGTTINATVVEMGPTEVKVRYERRSEELRGQSDRLHPVR